VVLLAGDVVVLTGVYAPLRSNNSDGPIMERDQFRRVFASVVGIA
jgi:hypothetical protein